MKSYYEAALCNLYIARAQKLMLHPSVRDLSCLQFAVRLLIAARIWHLRP